jgi:uncharacterized repeat protein (TIGR02543 family)
VTLSVTSLLTLSLSTQTASANVVTYTYVSSHSEVKGTVTNFANEQSASDGGLYATLAERSVTGSGLSILQNFETETTNGAVCPPPVGWSSTAQAYQRNTGTQNHTTGGTWSVSINGGATANLYSNTLNYTGYINAGVSYWFRGTATAAGTTNIYYSISGGAWNLIYTQTPWPNDSAFHQYSVSNITALNNQSSVQFKFEFVHTGGTSNSIDDIQFTADAASTYDMEIYETIASIPSADNQILQLSYELANANDTFNVQVWNGSAWNTRGSTLNSTSWTDWSYTLLSGEVISGTVQVRFVDVNSSSSPQDNILIDYLRVRGETAPIQRTLTMATSDGTTTPSVGAHVYDDGTLVDISATPPSAGDGENYLFNGWTGTGTGCYNGPDQSAQVTMSDNITETASWTHRYKLTMATNFGTTDPEVGDPWENADSIVSISATAPSAGPGENYAWNGWTGTGTGSYIGTDNPASVTMNGAITENASWTLQYTGLTTHGPILIVGNANFTLANGVTSGSGILGDPYTIENYIISASTANGIEIRDTTDYFVVRNCIIENGWIGENVVNYYGIKLSNAVNGRIENCICVNDDYGIVLYANSDNNVLTNNTCENSMWYGIRLESSSNNTITNNTCENTEYYGIGLDSSDSNNLDNNTCQNNGGGIYLYDSENIKMRNNTLSNNLHNFGMEGTTLSHFVHDIDNSNLVNGKPILYLIGHSNEVIGPSPEMGYLGLVSCDNILVEDLVLKHNIQGILIANTQNSQLENCVFENNGFGIYLWGSDNNVLTNNTCENGGRGIQLLTSNNNTLTNNTCEDDNYFGIRLANSNNNTVKNSTLSSENEHGVRLYSSTNNIIENNTISNDNLDGIWFENNSNSVNNIIRNNNITSNNRYGICIANSNDNNYIYHNNILNNATQAYDNGSNYWDNGYPSGGNYWSDYAGTDNYHGESQDIPGSDGIGDTPYTIPTSDQDRYPLMSPWPTTRSVSVSISPPSQSGVWGATLTYTVTVSNTGSASDTYTLDNDDTNGWTTMSLSTTSLVVPAFSSDNTTTLSVTIPVGGADDNITVTATSQTDNTVKSSAICTAQVTVGLVYNVDKDTWYTTIQAGVDDADPGNTIWVYPGTFTATSLASVVITKPLTLAGIDRDTCIIDGGAWGSSGAGWPMGIQSYADNVVIENFTIRGFNGDLINTGGYGVVFRNWAHDDASENYIFYQNCTLRNVRVENCYEGIYALVHQHLTVENCIVENTAGDGIFIARLSSNATVIGTSVTNAGNQGIWVGIDWNGIGPSNNATIINNTINGTWEGGITFDASAGAVISGNSVTNAQGTEPSQGGWSVGAISLKDGTSNVTVSNNEIFANDGLGTGSGRGIGIDGNSSNITITGNTIRNNAGGGIKVMGTITNLQCNYNDIYNNTGYGFNNTTATTVDAKFNWWGNSSGPGGSGPGTGDNISTKVLYSPWLGFTVGTVPMTFHVDNTGTIQSAIDAASSGDTVLVHNGTYRENLFIDKSITLKSASKPIIEAPDTIALSSYTGPSGTQNYNSIIEVYNTTGVTIDGFIIDGRGVGNANSYFTGIHFFEASGIISNNEIKGVMDTPLDGAQHGNAIVVNHLWDQYYAQSVIIENNVVYDYQKNGITCTESGTLATVENNIVTGAGPTSVIAQNGIEIGYGAMGTIRGNKVSGNSYTGSGWAAAGILVMDNSVDVLANEVDNNYFGIYYSNASGNISGNIVNASAIGTGATYFTGILIYPNNSGADTYTYSVTNNVLTADGDDTSFGIWVYAWSAHTINFTATRNTVNDWGWGFELDQEDSSTLNATAHFNTITNNVNYGMETDKPAASPVDATCNWWGDASGPYNPTTNPSSLGNSVSDNVTYAGWARAQIGTVWVGISPNSQSGFNGTTLTYTVTVQNTDSVSHTFDLTDNADPSWLPSLVENSLTILPNENGTATLSVTIPVSAIIGTIYNMTVTATCRENTSVSASSTCTAYVIPIWTGTATFKLENLYKVSLEKDLQINTGLKLVVKFYDYADTFQTESIIHIITPPENIKDNENVPQPMGTVQIARLVLTTEDTENVISTIASFTVHQSDLRDRYMAILRVWGDHPEQQSALRAEILDILRQWSNAPI